MAHTERSPYLPPLPNPWPRPPDLLPSLPPVDVDGAVAPVVSGPAESPTRSETEARPRVQLAGRLGQNPTLRTTPNGVLVARFPLGVKDQDDLSKTTWHTVLAFRDRAEQVRDQLKRGDAVEVVGYRHERTVPGRHGPRTVAEIYATLIKRR
jgi:primosomal replication protein N